MGEQRAVGAEHQLFAGQPAEALDEAALDLADVDGRVDGAAGVVKDVDAQQAVLAGEGVDGRLAQRGAVGEVVEGPATHHAGIVVELGGGVEAGVP